MQEKRATFQTFRERVGTALGRLWVGRRMPEALRRVADALRRTIRGGARAP